LWTDHINRLVIPAFYRLLQAQDSNDQVNHATELRDEIGKLINAADSQGPFFLGPNISFVDVQVAPWIVRLNKVLGPYRGWPEPEEGTRWASWVHAIEQHPSVKSTTSDDGLYLDSYERYAENRPNTSQLANAVNSGRGLP
jgi:glutathione S-transferase